MKYKTDLKLEVLDNMEVGDWVGAFERQHDDLTVIRIPEGFLYLYSTDVGAAMQFIPTTPEEIELILDDLRKGISQ